MKSEPLDQKKKYPKSTLTITVTAQIGKKGIARNSSFKGPVEPHVALMMMALAAEELGILAGVALEMSKHGIWAGMIEKESPNGR